LDAADFGGDFSGAGITAADRGFADAEAEPGGPDGQVIVEFVAGEDLPERLHARVQQETAAVTSEAVGGVGVMESGGEADEGRVQEFDAQQAGERGVFVATSRDEPRALDVIVTGVEFLAKGGDGFHAVLAVAVDSNDSFVALVEGEGEGHAHLCAQFAGAGLDEQRGDASFLQNAAVKRAVGAAAVGDDDIDGGGERSHLAQLFADLLSFVDHENADGIAMLLVALVTDFKGREFPWGGDARRVRLRHARCFF